LHASLGAGFNKAGTDIAGLFFAFNTRFLLNPTGDPGLADLSSIDIVARRQPERLLVSIGANNGLWEMGFAAEASAGIGGSTGPFNSQDLADLKTLISKLASLPRSVKHIYSKCLAGAEHGCEHDAGPGCVGHRSARPRQVLSGV
jgi:hypothetical protein